MRGKRTLALLLAVVLLLSGMLPASAEIGPAKTFSDVPANAWYMFIPAHHIAQRNAIPNTGNA